MIQGLGLSISIREETPLHIFRCNGRWGHIFMAGVLTKIYVLFKAIMASVLAVPCRM